MLERLRTQERSLPLPELVSLTRDRALVVTRLVAGEPLSWEWAGTLTGAETTEVANQRGGLLGRVHRTSVRDVVGDLPVVDPTPPGRHRKAPPSGSAYASTIVEERRCCGGCPWVDDVLTVGPLKPGPVLVQCDLPGYNQLWDRASSTLLAVVDFEESGIADPHHELRATCPATPPDLALTVAS